METMFRKNDLEYEHEVLLQFNDKMVTEERSDALAQGIAATVNEDECLISNSWSDKYQEKLETSRDPALAILDINSIQLRKSWESYINEDEKSRSKHKFKELGPLPSGCGIQDIKDTVSAVENMWRTKKASRRFHKANDHLHKFCDFLNAHLSFFEILPNEHEYLSIFCGASKVLIRASARYVKTAEEFSKALVDLSTNIEQCSSQAQIIHTEEMRVRVGEYYGEVFAFFHMAFDWFNTKWYGRLRTSFDDNFLKDLSDQLVKVEDCSKRILNVMLAGNAAEVRDMRLTLVDYVNRAEGNYETNEKRMDRLLHELEELKSEDHIKRLGRHIMDLLKESLRPKEIEYGAKGSGIQGQLSRRVTERATESMPYIPEAHIPQVPSQSSRADITYRREKILLHSSHLDKYTTSPVDFVRSLDSIPSHIDNNVAASLSSWTTSTTSEMLWIEGIYEPLYPSSMTNIGAAIVRAASMSENMIPVISFFCPNPMEEEELDDSGRNTDEISEQIFTNMIYSLIRQLLGWLPAFVETEIDLSASRFEALDGTSKTWEEGISLLSDLFNLAPPYFLLIIDGIEHLEDTLAESDLSQLLKTIQEWAVDFALHAEKNPGRDDIRRMKVLFLTAGNSRVLNVLDLGAMDVVCVSGPRSGHVGMGRRVSAVLNAF